MKPYDFYHKTDARKYGRGLLIVVPLFFALFYGVLYSFHAYFGMELDGAVAYGMYVIGGIVFMAFIAYAIFMVVKGGQWVFCIRDGVLYVESPVKSLGSTFSVPVEDIISITQKTTCGTEPRSYFYIVCKNGERYEITQNSGLDMYKLFEKLVEINPNIRREYTTTSDVFKRYWLTRWWFR